MLHFELDTIDELDDNVKGLYQQSDDGKYRLAVDGLPEVSGLKSALEKERKARRDFERKLNQLNGVDPDEYQRLKTEAEHREIEKAQKAGEWDKLRQQLADKHKAEIEAERQRSHTMQTTVESFLVDAEATRAIANAKGIPELLLPHVKQHVRVVQENGQYVARVVDKNGEPRVDYPDANPMTIAQLVEEMRKSDIYGRAFDGSGISGMGTGSTKPSSTASSMKSWDSKANINDKVNYIKSIRNST